MVSGSRGLSNVVAVAVVEADFRGVCRAAWLWLLVTCALEWFENIRANVATNNNEVSMRCCCTIVGYQNLNKQRAAFLAVVVI